MAKKQKQLDIEQAKQIRQIFSNLKFPGAHAEIQIAGIEELVSSLLKNMRRILENDFRNAFP